MKVAIAALLQETNTFSPQTTRRDHFLVTPSQNLISVHRNENSELHGFMDSLEEAGVEIAPVLGAWAVSYGRINSKDFLSLLNNLKEGLKKASPIQALLLALHGAWAGEGIDSCDDFVLSEVRKLLGPSVPIIATLDLHANLTRSMWKNADALVGYDTCPHVDLYQTGLRAGRLLVSTLRHEIRPTMEVVKIPMVVQAENMLSDRGEFGQIIQYAKSIEEQEGVVSTSVFACQPWLDVVELGWSALVITNNDQPKARALARDLAEYIWARRRAFLVALPSVDEALQQAMQIEGGPVVLGEGADGTMGGAPGDSITILAGILRMKLDVPVAAIVVDPEAVQEAVRAGVGRTIMLDVGGKLDPSYAKPMRITAKVKLISDGEFCYKGRVYTGRLVQMGKGVVFSWGKIRLLVSERPVPTTDPEMYRSHGIEPRDMKLVLVKSPLGLRTEYEPIARAIIIVNSPGCCSPDLASLPFRRIPRPIFPFDEFEFSASV
jgi:microcystin degradation protein MlrC